MSLSDFKKILSKHKSTLSALMFILAVVLIFWTVNNPAIVGVSASKRQLPVYCVQRDDKVVALSFDAAWGNEDTQTLIDILNKYNINTTFFVVGDWVDRYPESVQALWENGNEIMNHSSDHAHFSSLSTEQIISDLNQCNDKIASITGVAPTLFRCPYGEYDDHVINAVNSIGMTAVQWDVDSLDWKGLSAQEIEKRVTERVQPGSIVLFHNAAENTPEALPGIIESLLADGYTIVPVSQILLEGEYIIDNNGRQCSK